jgi:CRISPR/Cas system-associated protein Cas5 (RAMP superfamily)
MKATLKFDLPEDDHEFRMATTGNLMHTVLREMDVWLRSKTKYAPDSTSQDKMDAYELSREKLYQLLDQYNIDLE